jgi:hypothetical protein
MARKKTAEKLREEAKKLLEEAQKIEDDECLEYGRIVKKYMENNFEGFSLDGFKKELGLKVPTVKAEPAHQ